MSTNNKKDRKRRDSSVMVPPLLIAIVWAFFAVMCWMMAQSKDAFTPATITGFWIAFSVCSLLSFLGLWQFLLALASFWIGVADTPFARREIEEVDDLDETITRSDSTQSDASEHENSVVVEFIGKLMMGLLFTIRFIMFAWIFFLSIGVFAGCVMATGVAVGRWIGFIEPVPEGIFAEVAAVGMMTAILICCWRERSAFFPELRSHFIDKIEHYILWLFKVVMWAFISFFLVAAFGSVFIGLAILTWQTITG